MCLPLAAGAAHATTIDFGAYAAGTQITNQYAGVTISGGVIAAGNGGSNGKTAATLTNTNNSGVQMSFADLQSTVSGSYLASNGLSIAAYGASGNLLETVVLAATHGSNSSNWSVTGGAIASLSFVTATGSNFDLNAVNFADTATPGTVAAQTTEPGTLLLLGTGLIGFAGLAIYRSAKANGPELVIDDNALTA